ncbi:GNAT family N-acetyltransferase [Kitasatospora sp. NPDC088134]|uniref:GNAT family N-acetyltransferase n=1 Tax=Kitasatospora sp. NPDC088134 TaxID=3364071 RepID=UPI0037F4642A
MELPREMPELTAERGYRLRGWREADTELLREAAADPYIPLITTVPAPYGEAAAAVFLERQWRRTEIGTGYPFVLVDPEGRPVGHVGLWVADLALRGYASTGYWLAPSARGRGAAGIGLRAVTRWAREELGIARLELHVEPWNTASLRTAERSGYRRAELRPAHQQVGGEPRDMWRYVGP